MRIGTRRRREEKEGKQGEMRACSQQLFLGLVPSGKPELLFAFDFTNRSNAFVFAQGEFHGKETDEEKGSEKSRTECKKRNFEY